ncbi:MAG TPA: nicotinate-nucleotide--dimethylbenzimidazole phosphoribosyltransferase [Patescibacteria group bacterium]|nr:nicotinate-nucleotide--dimethylbenzimidazole phosphoribosyltransferase [Patescibacteria group bacterium]
MNLLQQTIDSIQPLNREMMAAAKKRLDHLAGGTGQLGKLSDMAAQCAGITGQLIPALPKKCMILMAADHGVARQGISAYPIETTIHMTKNYLISKGAGANALANFCQADLVVVDVGVAGDLSDLPGLWHRKIALGTKDFTEGPAMSREEAIKAVETGIEVVNTQIDKGYRCFSLGEMGIGNTTSSAAILAAFSGITPEQATGRGTGISDSRMQVKVNVVRRGLAVNQPDPQDGLDVLQKVGGLELGGLAGVILAAAARRSLVVIDGFNATAAALIAQAIQPEVRHYLIGSHLSAEQAHNRALEMLGLGAYIDMGLRLGEASGASLGMDLLDLALELLQATAGQEETI